MPKFSKKTSPQDIVKVPMYAKDRAFFHEFKLFSESWPEFFEKVIRKSFPQGRRMKK